MNLEYAVPTSRAFSDVIATYREADLTADRSGTKFPGQERSWDYCYRWFNHDRTVPHDERRDCLELGYYLASWGMFRGSGILMNTNLAAWSDTIRVIDRHHGAMQTVDLDGSDDEWVRLHAAYQDLERALPGSKPTATLVTKVMVGVWGCIPALDTYVDKGLRQLLLPDQQGFSTLTRRFYDFLCDLRCTHRRNIDHHSNVQLATFGTPDRWQTRIPPGKVLDTYLFQIGRETKP